MISGRIKALYVCIIAATFLPVIFIAASKIEGAEKILQGKKPIRIAVGSMITPKEGYAYYKQLLNYIGEKLGRPVVFVDREKYAEINEMLKAGDLDAAFVCSGPYVDGKKEFGLELLAVPQAYGKTVYYSYIIAPNDSPAKTLKDLRGKTFAFADPDSNTGKLAPTYMLYKMNETPETFFKKYVFTFAHDKSIRAVANKLVDGAAVDSLVYDYIKRVRPDEVSNVRIIQKSPPYGIPPFVVRHGLDSGTKKRLKEIFLNVHKDERGRKILKGMMIERFVEGNDAAYNSIGEMKAWIEKRKK